MKCMDICLTEIMLEHIFIIPAQTMSGFVVVVCWRILYSYAYYGFHNVQVRFQFESDYFVAANN